MKALLIIDIQNDYFERGMMPLSNSEEAARNAKKLLTDFRQKELPIIIVQHIASRPESGFFLPNTHGAEIHESVKPLNTEKIVVKHFPNSFRETDLDSYLNKSGIKDLVICGMMTHMCIDATTRAAKDLGYNCTIIGDACATRDLEIFGKKTDAKDVQNSFLSALNYFYAKVTTTEQYLKDNLLKPEV